MLLLDDPLRRFGRLSFDVSPGAPSPMAALFNEPPSEDSSQLLDDSLWLLPSPLRDTLSDGLPFDVSPGAPPSMAALFNEPPSLDSSRLLDGSLRQLPSMLRDPLSGGLRFDESPAATPMMAALLNELPPEDNSRQLPSLLLDPLSSGALSSSGTEALFPISFLWSPPAPVIGPLAPAWC